MRVLFIVPLTLIALYESVLNDEKNAWMKDWLRGDNEGDASYPEVRDPEVDEQGSNGEQLVISKVKFDELIKAFPNTTQVCDPFLVRDNVVLNFVGLVNGSGACE